MKIICPICGKEEFTKSDPPFRLYYEGGSFDEERPCMTCINCGYTIWFNNSIPKRYSETKVKISQLNKQIEKMNAEIEELEKKAKDTRLNKEAITKMKEDLIFYRKSGIENKTTRMLEECIAEQERIVNDGVNKEIMFKADKLKNDVSLLVKNRDSLIKSIELIK